MKHCLDAEIVKAWFQKHKMVSESLVIMSALLYSLDIDRHMLARTTEHTRGEKDLDWFSPDTSCWPFPVCVFYHGTQRVFRCYGLRNDVDTMGRMHWAVVC